MIDEWATPDAPAIVAEPDPWPHQDRGCRETEELIEAGEKRICVTSPTGGGKSYMMRRLMRFRKRVVLYTNRRMLLEQTSRTLSAAGIRHGIRADGYAPALCEDIQLSSIQSELSRVGGGKWDVHSADMALVDEAHTNAAETAAWLMEEHERQGAAIVGFTATPLDLNGLYNRMVVAGTPSELRECGALVEAVTYAPDEPGALLKKPDKQGRRDPEENLSDKQIALRSAKAPRHAIFARVFDHWKLLNPDARPAIGFAPGVKESLWFAEEFFKRGVTAAHIDGEDIWINGEWFRADQAARDYLAELVKTGRVKIVWNRFVLREGIDWPFLYHGIFATTFGSLSSYLQSGGRLLRAHKSLDHVIIQDHGGNWWRHGSLNADREWDLDVSSRIAGALRAKRMREKRELTPIVCVRCAYVRTWGKRCWRCNYEYHAPSRMVLESDGTLREVKGDIFRPRRVASRSSLVERKWKSIYFRAERTGMTFEQAKALYAKENKWFYPPENLPLMPTRELDWFRRVDAVPVSSLTGGQHATVS